MLKRVLLPFSVLMLLGMSSFAQESTEHVHGPAAGERYGHVHFAVSCTPDAQKQFDIAVSMLHSFFYPETAKAFAKVADIDPHCAMAYWGIAISQRPNPLVGPYDAATLKRGLDAIEKGESLDPVTQREKYWLGAMKLFYKDADKLDQGTRTRLYRDAMEQLHLHYPDDTEASIFYALALNEAASPADKTYASQLKAAAILEKVAEQQPDHPGILHYLIHSYDYEPLAARGLSAANRYAEIAPSAPHAQHMPSHIYTQLGMWNESIRSNKAALAAAKDYAAKNYGDAADPSEPHFLDFMEYDYLQLGQDKSARAVVTEASSLTKFPLQRLTVDAALAAIPARYALERGAWAEAAALEPRTTSYPYAEAITRFARAMGASKTGNSAGARQEIEKLRALREGFIGKPDLAYWADQVQVMILASTGWASHAEGHDEEAVKVMRSAADLEDASLKHVAMENRLFPMRELLGYMLLELNQPKLALAEFAASLKATPNRLRGFYGAGRAAELTGDRAAARTWYKKLVVLTQNAEGDRPEVVEAKKFLTSGS